MLIYQEPDSGGLLRLHDRNAQLARQFYAERHDKLLTIAWNRGPAQELVIDGVGYTFPANHFLALMVNQSFRFAVPEQVTAWQFNREFYCIVDHDKEVSCVGLLFYGSAEQLFLRLDAAETEAFAALLRVFADEFATRDNVQGEMLRMLLKRLIIKLTRLARQQYINHQLSDQHLDVVRRFNLLVENHYRTHHKVQQYADMLSKSPKTLSNLFALYNQKTPLQVIHDRIVLEAKRLLIYTDKSAKEIAYETGFEEIPHFSRFFKNSTGLSPTQFRENRQQAAAP